MAIPDKWKQFLTSLLPAGGPIVRPMTRDDLREVVRIIRLHDSDDAKAAKAYFERPGHFDSDYESSQHLVLIEPEEARVVGVSGFGADPSYEARGVFWLGWTYVNPFFRGRGYGAQLLHIVVEQVRRLGARKLYVETSSMEKFAAAVAFYQRVGFEHEGLLKDFYREGEDKIIMGMHL